MNASVRASAAGAPRTYNAAIMANSGGADDTPVSPTTNTTVPAPPPATPPPATPAAGTATPGPSGLPATEDGINYALVNIGDTVDNQKIKSIYAKQDNAIVFQSEDGKLTYRTNASSPAIDAAILELQRLTIKATVQLNGAYTPDVDQMIGAAFGAAMGLSDDKHVQELFKDVDAFIDAHAVSQVFGKAKDWIVFAEKDGIARLEYRDIPTVMTPIIGEFHRLAQVGRSADLSPAEIDGLNQLLGTELAAALRTTPPPDLPTAFALSKDLLQRKMEAHVRSDFTAASLTAAIVLGGVAVLTFWTDTGLLLGVTGGIIGAVISVLQRSATLEVKQFVPKSQVILQGCVRILLGILFGILLVGAVRAKLALGTLANSNDALFIFGVIAGLNERFIPDLLERVANQANTGTK